MLRSCLQIEPQELEELDGELPLPLGIEDAAVEDLRPVHRAVECVDQGDQRGSEALEHREQPGGGHLRLEVVEQRVVALAAVPDGIGLLPPQLEELLQRRREPDEGSLVPGDAPGLEPGGLGLGERPDQ